MAPPGMHVTTLQFVLSLEKLLGAKWLAVVEGWAKQEPLVVMRLPTTEELEAWSKKFRKLFG